MVTLREAAREIVDALGETNGHGRSEHRLFFSKKKLEQPELPRSQQTSLESMTVWPGTDYIKARP